MHCVRAVAWRPQSYSTSLSAPPPASHSSHGRLASRPHWSERVRVLKTPYSLSLCRAEPSQALSESLRRNQTQTLIFFFLSIKTKAKRVVSRPVSTPPLPTSPSMATWLCHCQQFAAGVGRENRLHSTHQRLGFLILAVATKSDQLPLLAYHTSQDSSWVGICGQFRLSSQMGKLRLRDVKGKELWVVPVGLI